MEMGTRQICMMFLRVRPPHLRAETQVWPHRWQSPSCVLSSDGLLDQRAPCASLSSSASVKWGHDANQYHRHQRCCRFIRDVTEYGVCVNLEPIPSPATFLPLLL